MFYRCFKCYCYLIFMALCNHKYETLNTKFAVAARQAMDLETNLKTHQGSIHAV